jgi:HlyD family secretion protein
MMNRRVRTVIGAGAALAVVAAIGIGVANTSSAASARYVTAIASTGDVTQTYTATGTITRKNTSTASFSVSGTVKSVSVAVGDEVEAGDTLATLNKGALQLAVLNAETSVAQAEATLYAAQHPSSSSSTSKSSASAKSGSGGTGGATAATILIDPVLLNEAVARINLAIQNEADKCNAIFATILPTASPTATPTATESPTSTATATPTATETPTPTASATATATADGGQTTAAQDKNPVATATASQLAKILDAADISDEDLQACADARAEVIAANTNLSTVVGQLTGGSGGGGASGGSGSGSQKSGSSSSSSTVSKSAVAKAKASVLSAEQDLATAKQNLSDATLVAPISGTVGTVGLTAGDSASGSITIVGAGSAVVTFELPLTTRELVKVGQSVTVTPAGSTKTLSGKITAIASLETSGTSGDTPTYATTVSVTDTAGLLATGAKASVQIPVKAVTGVVRVPASAVTPTGSGTATVQVVDSANANTASSVTVKTGAVGGGWVQISSGLDAGKIVVLADTTAEIPSNTSNRRTTTTRSSSSSSSSSSAAATAVPTASGSAVSGSVPSSAPTASASR